MREADGMARMENLARDMMFMREVLLDSETWHFWGVYLYSCVCM